MDEADRFYYRNSEKEEEEGDGDGGLYGVEFLREEMWGGDGLTSSSASGQGPEEIPRYIIGFEGVEEMLRKFFEEDKRGRELGVELKKVWSAWNGAFNEDWRRRGRLVVWDTGVYEPVEEVKRKVFA